jgi:hypothetical protein
MAGGNKVGFSLSRKFASRLMLVCLTAVLVIAGNVQPLIVQAAEQDDYTVLVYMNGSDLESADLAGAGTSDLQEMMAAGSTEHVNIVVETGGTLAWANDVVDADKNQRWLVEQNGLVDVGGELGKRNIGEADTLSDFITWGVNQYPAKQYALILWDHGAGSVFGFGADEHFAGDSLTLDEIQQAMKEAYDETGATFELVGFDACLMAAVEVASILSPYANYLVASEELEPGHGWEYTSIVQAVSKNPAISGDRLGKVIVDSFKAHAEDSGTQDEITLSVIDLVKIKAVEQALDKLVAKLTTDIIAPKRMAAISGARSKSEDYGSIGQQSSSTDMIDLADFAKHVRPDYPELADALILAVNDAVVHNINSKLAPNAQGLSIYFPYEDKQGFELKYTYYDKVDFSPSYKAFVAQYAGLLTGDIAPIQLQNSMPEKADLGTQAPTEEQPDTYGITIEPDQLDEITELYAVLFTYGDTEDDYIFLGMDPSVELDEETGELFYDFTGEWPTLNENFISLYVSDVGDDYTEYSIPALLNDEEVDIIVVADAEGEIEILGAWRGIDEETHMADKNIIKIKDGDRITPEFYFYNEVTDEEGFYSGDEFVVNGSLELSIGDLPDGDYLYGFEIVDYAQNSTYSDFVEISLETVGDEEEEASEPSGNQAGTSTTSADITVILNGEEQHFAQPPVMVNGSTLVPLRDIFEAPNAEIEWEGSTKTVFAAKGERLIELQINAPEAYVDGEAVKLQQPGQIIGGKTMVPLRFVSEALGADVGWDGSTKTITINE